MVVFTENFKIMERFRLTTDGVREYYMTKRLRSVKDAIVDINTRRSFKMKKSNFIWDYYFF